MLAINIICLTAEDMLLPTGNTQFENAIQTKQAYLFSTIIRSMELGDIWGTCCMSDAVLDSESRKVYKTESLVKELIVDGFILQNVHLE